LALGLATAAADHLVMHVLIELAALATVPDVAQPAIFCVAGAHDQNGVLTLKLPKGGPERRAPPPIAASASATPDERAPHATSH
jgi:hypothetical protein